MSLQILPFEEKTSCKSCDSTTNVSIAPTLFILNISEIQINTVLQYVTLGAVLVATPVIVYFLYKIYKSFHPLPEDITEVTEKQNSYEKSSEPYRNKGVFTRLKTLLLHSKIKYVRERALSIESRAKAIIDLAKSMGAFEVYTDTRDILVRVAEILSYDEITVLAKFDEIEHFLDEAKNALVNAEERLNELNEKLEEYDKLREEAHNKIQEIINVLEQLESGGVISGGEVA